MKNKKKHLRNYESNYLVLAAIVMATARPVFIVTATARPVFIVTATASKENSSMFPIRPEFQTQDPQRY